MEEGFVIKKKVEVVNKYLSIIFTIPLSLTNNFTNI